ncbi:hypothetical protein ZIOFF_034761 [Zingiber officinale]|uniref:Cation-transporting P-type ATPase N-terminal domain-containing protein n=1 Tax=Zingiber officinale TaxID=94328 RepID=A0A8J5L267_ZINOF|nr:hypothetical protein ZIOFF_034761 [Zingiber officinale]
MNDAYAKSVPEVSLPTPLSRQCRAASLLDSSARRLCFLPQVLEAFGVDPSKGLSDFQVSQNANIYGRNELPEEESTPFWRRVLKQFDDLLVKILIAAAIVSFLLALINGETGFTAFLEPSVILMILAANAAVGVITETNAEKALEELRAYQADVATVLRNDVGRFPTGHPVVGQLCFDGLLGYFSLYSAQLGFGCFEYISSDSVSSCFSILPATELVPGDIVEVGVGCKVPADLRMMEMLSSQLRVDQAILTGESCSVAKDLEPTVATNAVYQDKTNILFSGTVVVVGRARAIVVGVGSNTAMGSIRDAMLRTNDETTPLKKKLDEFGTFLAKVIAGICVLVWVVNIGHFHDPSHGGIMRGAIHYFKDFEKLKPNRIIVELRTRSAEKNAFTDEKQHYNCLTLFIVKLRCLALGTKRMARLNAIVRSLPSVETLGCTTVICSDKTGTLTTNMMSVSKVCVVQSVHRGPITYEYAVTGTTFAPEGMIFDATGVQLEFPAQFPCLLHIAMCSALCNESMLQYNPDKKNYEKIGESTEVALRVLVEKVGLPGFDSMPSALNILSKHERASYCNHYWEHQFKKMSVLEFSRDRKMMSVLCSRKQQEIMFSKGAPECIISRCTHILCNEDGSSVPLTNDIRIALEERFRSFAGKDTLRCLALALKRMPMGQQTLCYDDEINLTFIGLIGMLDPPRNEVRNAMLSCMSAGIRVIVVTGDNKTTAESLCRRIGAFDHLNDFTGYSYTASEFEELSPTDRALALQRMVLFTRWIPIGDIEVNPSKGLDRDIKDYYQIGSGTRGSAPIHPSDRISTSRGYAPLRPSDPISASWCFAPLCPSDRIKNMGLCSLHPLTQFRIGSPPPGALLPYVLLIGSLLPWALLPLRPESPMGLSQESIPQLMLRMGLSEARETISLSFSGQLQSPLAGDPPSSPSRVEPSHKRMLVEALQNQNEVVAMTGDGVNDAPALKKADIGIAMGSGTAVAKSASDMVLADDNFASIVAAVAEGRAIYTNTKQFIRYMISSNIGEVVCIFVAAVLGMPDTLVPVQLLWVNLVTDGLPATAIGFNKLDTNVMMAKPRKVNEAVVTGWLFFRYLVIGAYVGLATIAGFVWWFVYSDKGPKLPYNELVNFDSCSTRETSYPCSIFDDRHPSTVSMTVLVVVEMFNALNNLSENQSLLVIPPWSNIWLLASIALTMFLHVLILYVEPLSTLFAVAPLSWTDWAVVLYLSFPVEGSTLGSENMMFFQKGNAETSKPGFLNHSQCSN